VTRGRFGLRATDSVAAPVEASVVVATDGEAPARLAPLCASQDWSQNHGMTGAKRGHAGITRPRSRIRISANRKVCGGPGTTAACLRTERQQVGFLPGALSRRF